jgi:hypothetical protein
VKLIDNPPPHGGGRVPTDVICIKKCEGGGIVKETGKREDKKINMCKREESKGKKRACGE